MLSLKKFVREYKRIHPDADEARVRAKYAFGVLRFGTTAVDEEDIMYLQPILPTVSRVQQVTAIRCTNLPVWMNRLVDNTKAYFDSMYMHRRVINYKPVFIEPDGYRYVFGACGTFNEPVDFLLEVIRQDPRFQACYVRGIYLDTVDIPGRRRRSDIEDYNAFCDDDTYKVALFATVTNDAMGGVISHARLLIKSPAERSVIITDPHGEILEHYLPDFEQSYIARALEEAREEHKRVSRKYPFVTFREQRTDQTEHEGACGALTFMRMLYVLYMSYTHGTEPLQHMEETVPCKFAVFLSRLFQQARIIDHDTHGQVVRPLVS